MIEQARQELARGHPAAAADLFEQAAEHGEYEEAEVGEVRARLWAGQFRHAVAISSVVAGEHPESAEAQALLGFIEDRNGYTAQALQRLREEQQSRPGEAAPVAAEAEVRIDRHSPREAIELIDRWVTAHGAQPDLCRLRSRYGTSGLNCWGEPLAGGDNFEISNNAELPGHRGQRRYY
jgi:predicted Zn-dependent protease